MKGLGVVGEKSYAFAIRIVNAYKILCRNNEFVLSKQLLRSGTAIGALCSEAQHAQSKADFLNKMNILYIPHLQISEQQNCPAILPEV